MVAMEVSMRAVYFVVLFVSVAGPMRAQTSATVTSPPPVAKAVSLSGPRFGLTVFSDGVVEKLHETQIEVRTAITQFGWQFEREFYSREGGLAAVNEGVILVGGLEQGVVLPSLNWLVGLRTSGGAEFGIGPNLTPAGVALAFAAGFTFRSGVLNVPVNLAIVPSRSGMRVSLLTGFNMRARR
jgi:hypothetical protein